MTKRKVCLYCVECGKYLGEFYGHVKDEALIKGQKYVLCPVPLAAREDEGGCSYPIETQPAKYRYNLRKGCN